MQLIAQRLGALENRTQDGFSRMDRRLSEGFARNERRFDAVEGMLYSIIHYATGTEEKVSALVTKTEVAGEKDRPT